MAGGTLRVSHKGKEIKYAWGGVQNPQTVEWAAFFSDCEHEVREVTSGSRVTLTYNLYMADYPRRVIEGVSPPFSPLNPQSYPMYGTVKIFLRDLEFMKEGMLPFPNGQCWQKRDERKLTLLLLRGYIGLWLHPCLCTRQITTEGSSPVLS